MWVVNRDTNKWTETIDNNSVVDFESYKQELESIRFYQKCLSGSTYVTTGNTDDLYDILGEYIPRSYRYDTSYSPYSIPGTQYPHDILVTSTTSGTFSATEFRDKFMGEYGLTLKNLFTPERLIKDQNKNLLYVDIATTESLNNIGQYSPNLVIDDVRLKEGHRVLVKNQFIEVTLDNSINPDDYFVGFYELVTEGSTQSVFREYTSENGIYHYINRTLVRTTDLDLYDNLVRYSVCVKLGTVNRELQFNLGRLKNGFFPVYQDGEPIYFVQSKNYVLRNRVDYNNLYELLLNWTVKYDSEEYFSDGVTYSIPQRTITLGEFGQIFITQEGETIIVNNKFKTNLRSLDQTTLNYWVCGDDGIILKIRKLDLLIERVYLGVETQLNCINFFNDLRGVVVGRFNQIWITSNGGKDWSRLNFPDFEGFNFNTVQFANIDTFYVGGDNGVFIEFKVSQGEWTAFKRRVSRFENSLDDEWVLVDDITSISYFTYSNPYVAIGARNNNIYLYDIQNSISDFSFLYINGGLEVGDVTSLVYGPSGSIYFSTFNSIYEFSPFGMSPSVYNIIQSTFSLFFTQSGINSIYNYNDQDLVATGGNSNWISISFSNSTFVDVYNDNDRDEFFGRLKPRLLFMNYDIGSKLYWFDDYRQYRIPERLILPVSDFLNSSIVDFQTISGQVSWLDYWKDRMKTFKYASGNMSESTAIRMSFEFRQDDTNAGTYSYIGSTDVGITYSSSVMPIVEPSRFRDSLGSLLTISVPSTPLYFYEYLGVWENPGIQEGDVIQIKSDVVEGRFIVNRVSGDYGWFFTDFNENIVKNLSESTNIVVKNLNVYNSTDLELFIDNFKNHYIFGAYGIDNYEFGGTQSLEIYGKYSRYSAYYNLQADVILDSGTYTLEYPEGFLNFGYTPDYNLFSYLSFIDSTIFDQNKEYSSLPVYENIPVSTTGIYIDNGIQDHNKLYFSEDLRNEWESLQLWTFVDIETDFTNSPFNEIKERLIITKKYVDESFTGYPLVIEFHDKINIASWIGSDPTQTSIRTRRNILQISEDLRYLNNFHRPLDSITEVWDFSGSLVVSTFSNYDTKINSKIPMDSYVKALLSDSQTVEALTGIIYTDYKNELAMQIHKLDREFDYEVIGTSISPTNEIVLAEEHGLSEGDSVTLYFDGTQSLYPNPQVLGIHPVTGINGPFSLLIGDPSLNITLTSGLRVTWVKKDPFLNYQPIDIFDQGIGDKKIKKAVEILPENYDIDGRRYFLQNVNYNKYRYRLIDGLDLEYLTKNFEWVLEAEIRDAVIGMDVETRELIWYKGIWECGRWFGGRWISGIWKSGDWYDGIWESKVVRDNYLTVKFDPTSSSNNFSSQWFGGRWFGGYWDGGTWYDGRWYGGTWNSGRWFDGTWNDGEWNNGQFTSGIWVLGLWRNGLFNTNNGPSFWLDGKFYGGDFENGIWYNGEFKRLSTSLNSRFGTKASNTRNSNWLGGKFTSGEFHSLLNLDDNGNPDVSNIHKYSNWYTGFFSGDFYGGNAYHMNFSSGVWHGGILNDIDIVGINATSSNNYFLLEGVWRFNIGDQFYVVDDQVGGTYSVFGTTENPTRYRVIYASLDEEANTTKLTVDIDLSLILPINTGDTPIDTDLKIVSKFTNAIWNSGIWFNGVFESGNFNSGMWYNGNFSGTWG